MQALFTGGLGDFIGAESFMSDKEKDSVTTVCWATRNREEIRAAVDLRSIFPNMVDEKILFDDFCDERPTRDWQPGDRFMNIGKKQELNLKCGLNLSQAELDAISDHSLDATLEGIFAGRRRFQSSRIATRTPLPDVSHFNLPDRYIVIHPWSDAEINGREFNESDWPSIFKFLNNAGLKGVVVNQSKYLAPKNDLLIDLTNKTNLKETLSIIKDASGCILCASSLACFATKIFPIHKIWLKGGHPHMFSEWATRFYHGPFTKPGDVIFKDLKILELYKVEKQSSNKIVDLDQGVLSLI
jgi:hypothetical protein